jgi:uncharacterized protein (DUF2461 family)
LKLHDPDFRVSFQDFTTFAEKVSDKIIEADETIPELPVKDVIYRIYRDIRFSKDPTPYKTYFSAAWSRTVSYLCAAVNPSHRLTLDTNVRDEKVLTRTTTFRCNPKAGAL